MLKRRNLWLAALVIPLLAAAGFLLRKPRLRSSHWSTKGGMINVVDPRMLRRLVNGFEGAENNYWRWTAPEFSVILTPPLGAAEKGAVLVLRFMIPEDLPSGEKSVDLNSTVNGVALPPRHYDGPGQFTLQQEVPAAALAEDPVRVDFKVDRPSLPSSGPARGVIVSEVGLERK
jgi:hypothetical protein